LAVPIREPKVAAGVAIPEPFVIEAEYMEESGVQVVNGNAIRDGAKAEIVRRAVAGAPP
jgi:hypothetical protein